MIWSRLINEPTNSGYVSQMICYGATNRRYMIVHSHMPIEQYIKVLNYQKAGYATAQTSIKSCQMCANDPPDHKEKLQASRRSNFQKRNDQLAWDVTHDARRVPMESGWVALYYSNQLTLEQWAFENGLPLFWYTLYIYRVAPKKTEQSIQSIFQDFALINSYLFSPCWIEHFLPHYNNTKIIKFGQ